MYNIIEEIQELKKEKTILTYQECVDHLQFLIVFSLGYLKYNITPNPYKEAVDEFVSVMNTMGYGHDVITKIVTQISTQPDVLIGKLSYKKIEL